MRRILAAIRAFIDTLTGEPYFDLDSQEQLTADQWAALMVLHCEAVHACEHTGPARAELGMVGPRGKAVEA